MAPATQVAGAGEEELPLFPLGSVLLPGGPLRLRIFEPRYLAMIGRCMRAGAPFGVVLILEGEETGAGGAKRTAPVGTSARIVDFDRLPDGLLGISCLGERRFRVLERAERDGLSVGRVQWLPEPPVVALPDQYAKSAQILRQALPQLGDLYAAVPPHFEDAQWVGCRLTELLPLTQAEKQGLLELEDPLERLRQVAPLFRA